MGIGGIVAAVIGAILFIVLGSVTWAISAGGSKTKMTMDDKKGKENERKTH